MSKYEKIKISMIGVMSTLAFLILINATTNKSILKVKELHIIDESENTRIKMSIQKRISSLCFYDLSGKERINLKQWSIDNTEFRMSGKRIGSMLCIIYMNIIYRKKLYNIN